MDDAKPVEDAVAEQLPSWHPPFTPKEERSVCISRCRTSSRSRSALGSWKSAAVRPSWGPEREPTTAPTLATTPRTICAANEQRILPAQITGKSKPHRPGAASKAVATRSPSLRTAARWTTCILGAAPSSALVVTISADASGEALPSFSSPAAALVEHPPCTGREKNMRPSSAGEPSPELHDDPRQLPPSWAAAAAPSCGPPSPRATARTIPATTSTAAACSRTPKPRRCRPAVADTGGVGCMQHEHCRVKIGVPLSEKFADRGLDGTDAREEALSRVLNQWRVRTSEGKTYRGRRRWCRPRQVSDAEEAGRRGTGRARYTFPARSVSMAATSSRAPLHVSAA